MRARLLDGIYRWFGAHYCAAEVARAFRRFARGERISTVANLRDDPLGALWARHQIDDAKYVAGRHWQRLYEAAEIGTLRGMDLTRERVDGGGNGVEILTDARTA